MKLVSGAPVVGAPDAVAPGPARPPVALSPAVVDHPGGGAGPARYPGQVDRMAPPRGLRRRYRSARQVVISHTLVTDTVFALLVGVISTPWVVTTDPSVDSWLLQVGLLVPLVWRRRYPTAVFAVVSAVALLQWFAGVQLVADLSLLVSLSTLATYRPRRFGLTAAALLELGAVMASFRWSLAGSWARSLVFLSGLVAAGLLLGTNLRARRELVASLTQRADRLERERDQQALIAAAAERTRIAREMHDVIGHSLAVMISLADGAGAKLAADPDRAATAIGHVSSLGRQALGETRRLLGVLRADDTGDGFTPLPDLARLDELVSQVRATGLEATLLRRGDARGLSAGIELTVYRIVQEAVTNTLKHAAAPTRVAVRVVIDEGGIDIDVTDDGGTDDVIASASRLDRLRRWSTTDPGDGHGLVGMRERAGVYGGRVTAGPDGHGWAVRVRLPTTGP